MRWPTRIAYVASFLTISVAAAGEAFIRLEQADDRWWLVKPSGERFFAHGITHGNIAGKTGGLLKLSDACRDIGFNAFGYGCPQSLRRDWPYFDSRNFIPTSMYRTSDKSFRFVDVFDPGVQRELTDAVGQMCMANRDNANLIGYYWTDLTAWPLENWAKKNWVNFIRCLPANTPGRLAYDAFLMEGDWADSDTRDRAFLRLIAREYFRVFGEATKRFDPDHLVFGDRLTLQTAIPEVVEEMAPYVDAIAIQPPFQPQFPAQQYARIHEISGGKPIVLCDFAIRFQDGDKTIRGWKPLEDSVAGGEAYARYIRNAMATPYVVGAFWCNPIDSKPSFQKSGIKQGFFDADLNPRAG